MWSLFVRLQDWELLVVRITVIQELLMQRSHGRLHYSLIYL